MKLTIAILVSMVSLIPNLSFAFDGTKTEFRFSLVNRQNYGIVAMSDVKFLLKETLPDGVERSCSSSPTTRTIHISYRDYYNQVLSKDIQAGPVRFDANHLSVLAGEFPQSAGQWDGNYSINVGEILASGKTGSSIDYAKSLYTIVSGICH